MIFQETLSKPLLLFDYDPNLVTTFHNPFLILYLYKFGQAVATKYLIILIWYHQLFTQLRYSIEDS